MIEPCHADDCIHPHCSPEMGCRLDDEKAAASQFIGHFTLAGPHGYVEGPSAVSVKLFTEALLRNYGHALSGQVRKVWFQPLWRVQVWSRIELSGN